MPPIISVPGAVQREVTRGPTPAGTCLCVCENDCTALLERRSSGSLETWNGPRGAVFSSASEGWCVSCTMKNNKKRGKGHREWSEPVDAFCEGNWLLYTRELRTYSAGFVVFYFLFSRMVKNNEPLVEEIWMQLSTPRQTKIKPVNGNSLKANQNTWTEACLNQLGKFGQRSGTEVWETKFTGKTRNGIVS